MDRLAVSEKEATNDVKDIKRVHMEKERALKEQLANMTEKEAKSKSNKIDISSRLNL